MRIGYQGEPGAFSESAIRTHLSGADPCGYPTFNTLLDGVARGEIERALLPMHNTIAGPVDAARDALRAHPGLHVVGEIAYRVVQNVLGLPDATLAAITEVRSHPVALAQCRRFLAQHPRWRRLEVLDTAGAVREIMHLRDPAKAAIGAREAALRYGAVVLAADIADDPHNITTFAIIASRLPEPSAR